MTFPFFSEDSVCPVCSVVCRTPKGRYSKDLSALFQEPLVYALLVDNKENEIPGENSPSLKTSKECWSLHPSIKHEHAKWEAKRQGIHFILLPECAAPEGLRRHRSLPLLIYLFFPLNSPQRVIARLSTHSLLSMPLAQQSSRHTQWEPSFVTTPRPRAWGRDSEVLIGAW